ncbi:MAG: hypothetical protein R3E60_05700 [Alphaproteobacteria bacterium]
MLHYTDTVDAASALEILCDPARKVSAHYLIEENVALFIALFQNPSVLGMQGFHFGTEQLT